MHARPVAGQQAGAQPSRRHCQGWHASYRRDTCDHAQVHDSRIQVRHASTGDADAVAGLAGQLAMSFEFSREQFDVSYPVLLDAEGACLLLAVSGDDHLGYLLGFRHITFYANGPVAWVEEILVSRDHRGRGIGRALMTAFERWSAEQECVLVALATRRAMPFYLALGYQQSAAYLRKVLPPEAAR